MYLSFCFSFLITIQFIWSLGYHCSLIAKILYTDMNFLPDVWFANLGSHPVGYLLIPVNVSFVVQNFLISQDPIVNSYNYFLYCKIFSKSQMLYFQVFSFSKSYIQFKVSDPFWVGERKSFTSTLLYSWYLASPVSFVEEVVNSWVHICPIFVEIQVAVALCKCFFFHSSQMVGSVFC